MVVFVTRYLDLLEFISLYNTLFKIFFIVSSAYICYLMKFRFKATWDPALDTFRIDYLVGTAAILGLLFNEEFSITEASVSGLSTTSTDENILTNYAH